MGWRREWKRGEEREGWVEERREGERRKGGEGKGKKWGRVREESIVEGKERKVENYILHSPFST